MNFWGLKHDFKPLSFKSPKVEPRAVLAVSRIFALVFSALTVSNLTACAGFANSTPNAISVYTVQRGDTLSLIAQRFGTTFAELVRLNNLTSPYSIHTGQVLRVPFPPPETEIKPLTDTRKRTGKKTSPPVSSSPLSKLEKNACAPPVPLHYPTQGGTPSRGTGGMNIFGQAGQAIYAIAAGQVAYSGKGVKGYPNLVIIKHNDQFMSIYAHNANLRVHQGTWVQAGQHLADMGMNAKRQGMLRFELNCRGKRVDPMLFFPH
jgi:lipoprotein NlpD